MHISPLSLLIGLLVTGVTARVAGALLKWTLPRLLFDRQAGLAAFCTRAAPWVEALVWSLGIAALLPLVLGPSSPLPWAFGILWLISAGLVTILSIHGWRVAIDVYTGSVDRRRGTELGRSFGPILRLVGSTLAFFFLAIVTLDHFGVNITAFVATAGVASLAVALGAQDTLGNLFAGFTLLLDGSFRTGDVIALGTGESGQILEIGMRSTRIRAGDNTSYVIPNRSLATATVINRSFPETRLKLRLPISVARDEDPEKVKEALLAAAASVGEVLKDPPPEAYLTAVGKDSQDYLLVTTFEGLGQEAKAKDGLLKAILRELAKHHIKAPLPG